MIVDDIIRSALTKIGVIPIGEPIPADWTASALIETNDMLQEWAVEGLLLHAMTMTTVATVNAQALYTIGTGGNFNVRRPAELIDAVLTVSAGVFRRIDVWNTIFRYRGYASRPAGSPRELFYDPLFPLGNIYFYPTPDAIYSVELTMLASLAPFAASTDTILLPPEYQSPLELNLAVHLLPVYGKTDAILIDEADKAKAALMANNAKRFVRKECAHPHLARNHFCMHVLSGAR